MKKLKPNSIKLNHYDENKCAVILSYLIENIDCQLEELKESVDQLKEVISEAFCDVKKHYSRLYFEDGLLKVYLSETKNSAGVLVSTESAGSFAQIYATKIE